MKQQILLSAQELFAEQKRKACIVADCRFVLSDPGSGYKDYLKAHIPGAVYAHLDDDLSSPCNQQKRSPSFTGCGQLCCISGAIRLETRNEDSRV